jgi:hypothetical protein
MKQGSCFFLNKDALPQSKIGTLPPSPNPFSNSYGQRCGAVLGVMEASSSSYGSGVGRGEEKELRLLEVQAAASALRRSEVFNIVKELLGSVLYMHHQIPS